MYDDQSVAGPSKPRMPTRVPPQPPVHDDLRGLARSPNMYSTPDFSDTRYRTAKVDMSRRPHSTYPSTGDEPVFHLPRKYTDPTPHTAAPYEPPSPNPSSPSAQLDVDLDVYSQEYYDVEDDLRQPSLSIVTSSTVDSTTSSPSIPDTTYTYGTERFDRKQQLEPEPRVIRMRTNAGRQNAYSSAESSLASGAYSGQFSYHAYSDNTHPQPPVPDINLSSPIRSHQVMEPDLASANSCTDTSNTSGTAFSPGVYAQSWRSPVMNRARSHSETTTESTDDTTDSASGCDRLSQAFANSFGYLGESPRPWDSVISEPTALALVDDGRSKILNVQQIEAMGGLPTLARMSENELLRLPRYTHLLLSGIGPDIMTVLPQLLDVLSTTLVVLDVSDNNLGTLPTGLRHCTALEELNVSGNPLRALPPFLADCQQLRLFAADNCLLTTLPQELSTLQSLHTLCIRGNRMVVLPSWICLLTRLEALRIDNNPFAPQWRSIVAPILTSTLGQNSPYPSHSRTASAQSSVHSLSMGSVRSSHASVTNLVASSASSITNDSSLGIGYPSEPSTPSRSVTPAAGIDDTPTAGPIQSLRTTRAAPRPPMPVMPPQQTNGSRAPNRSASHPQPSSEIFTPSERMSGTGPSRRVQSAVGPGGQPGAATPDDSEDGGGKHKWGFLRKVSISRLRTEKDYTAQLNASAAANLSSMPTLPHTHSAPNGIKPRRPTLTSGWSTSVVPTRSHNLTPGSAESAPVSPPNGLSTSASSLPHLNTHNLAPSSYGAAAAMRRNKRRSFLPIDPSPPSLNGVSIPSLSPLMAPQATLAEHEAAYAATSVTDDNAMETLGDEPEARGTSVRAPSSAATHHEMEVAAMDQEARYTRGLESIKSYLRDLYELSLPALEPYGGFEVVEGAMFNPISPLSDHASLRDSTQSRQPTMESVTRDSMRGQSMISVASERRSTAVDPADLPSTQVKRFKDDKSKRAGVIREIFETENTYVRGLQELIAIYVQPASQCISSKSNETLIPLAERKVVFGGVESILVIHRDNFLPALERVIEPLLRGSDDSEGTISARIAHQVGEVFRTYIAYMKQYSTYINNFDNALQRMRSWTLPVAGSSPSASTKVSPSSGIGVAAIGAGLIGSAVLPVGDGKPMQHSPLQPSQRKRVKHFLKKCKENPRHSQINLESYLLLPVQRVPRYKLLLEDLAMCTPPRESLGPSDALDDAINEIANLASLMNEEKREAESRLRLLHWQQRITSRGPSPLVQPHRKLVLDGALQLIRVVKKTSAFAEVDYSLPSGSGDNTITTSKSVIPIEFIKPEPMDKAVMLILCSDMLVLVQKRNDAGWDGPVDLFSVLRMATLKEPASILHSNDRVLRVVDNKSIYYFNGGSHSTALQWCRAINGQNRK